MAATAGLLAVAFALSTYERWLGRRRRHELAWTAALAMFALASFALAAGSSVGWSGPVYRTFFLFGAIANVPFLALGTVYLLGGRRIGDRSAAGVVVFTAFSAGVLATAPFTAPLPVDELAQGRDVFGPLPRILAATSSGVASLVVIGGALWSAWRFRRGRMVVANVLIALGTGITGASGLLNSVFDEITGFAVALALGIAVIFAGFLVATAGGRAMPRPAALSAGPGATASRPGPAAAARRR